MAGPDRHPVEGPDGARGGSWADLARLCAAADAALAGGSLDEAEALYAVVLGREPDHGLARVGKANVQHRRALVLERKGRLDDAVELCREALSVEGTTGTGIGATLRRLLVRRARDHDASGAADKAQTLLEESIRTAQLDGALDDLTPEFDGTAPDAPWGILVARAALAVERDPMRAAQLAAVVRARAETVLPDGVEEAIELYREAVRIGQGYGLPHDAVMHERFADLLIAQARPALACHDVGVALDLAVEAVRVDPKRGGDDELLARLVAAGEPEGLYTPTAELARARYERNPEDVELAEAVIRLLRRDGDARRAVGDVRGAAKCHRDALRIEQAHLGEPTRDNRRAASAALRELAFRELATGEPARAGALLAETHALAPGDDSITGELVGAREVAVVRRIAALRELMALCPAATLTRSLVELLHERARELDSEGEGMRARHVYREALSLQRQAGGLAAAPTLCADAARALRASTRLLVESGDILTGLHAYGLMSSIAAYADGLEADPELDRLLASQAPVAVERRLQSSDVVAAAELARDLARVAPQRFDFQLAVGGIVRAAAGLEEWGSVIEALSDLLSADANLAGACAALLGREALAAERRGDAHLALRNLRRGRELARMAGEQPEAKFAEGQLRVLARLAEHRIAADLPQAARGLLEELRALAPGDDRLPALERALQAAGGVALVIVERGVDRAALPALLEGLDDPEVHVEGEQRLRPPDDLAVDEQVGGDLAALLRAALPEPWRDVAGVDLADCLRSELAAFAARAEATVAAAERLLAEGRFANVLLVLGDDVLCARLHAAAARAVGAERVSLARCSASGHRDERPWPLHEYATHRPAPRPPAPRPSAIREIPTAPMTETPPDRPPVAVVLVPGRDRAAISALAADLRAQHPTLLLPTELGTVPDAPLAVEVDGALARGGPHVEALRAGRRRLLPMLSSAAAELAAERLPVLAAYAAGLAAELDRERPAVLVLPPEADAEARVAAALAGARGIATVGYAAGEDPIAAVLALAAEPSARRQE